MGVKLTLLLMYRTCPEDGVDNLRPVPNFAPLALRVWLAFYPGALPQALIGRPNGAFTFSKKLRLTPLGWRLYNFK